MMNIFDRYIWNAFSFVLSELSGVEYLQHIFVVVGGIGSGTVYTPSYL